MMPASTLALAGIQHDEARSHLFPGDGCEAATILLCARTPGPRLKLVVRDMISVPHDACARRERDAITWPGAYLEEAIDKGEAEGLAIILLHSHPGGLFAFSEVDDASDAITMSSLFQAYGDLHGSAIMTRDGAIRARLYGPDLQANPVELVTVAGDDLHYWWANTADFSGPSNKPIAFTSGMTQELARLHAVIIGVSGTGSIDAEQAARLGFGRVTMIDYDRVERKNLNRILNTSTADAAAERLKVDAFSTAITAYRGEGVAIPLPKSIDTRAAVIAASQGDVIFCCVDTLDARYMADLISSAFLIPLIDVGVVIPVRASGGIVAIADAVGRIDYVQPGGATLGDRKVYTPETLRAEYLRRVAPAEHAHEIEAGYLKGVVEEAPAVITLNMRAAAASMNEFILRAYPFRLEPNRNYARTRFSLAGCDEDFFAEDSFDKAPNPLLGRGAREPLLGLPALVARDTTP